MRSVTLDILRVYACILVVIFHWVGKYNWGQPQALKAAAEYGWLGVPIFFMISGFIISESVMTRKLGDFALSRFIRLYSAYLPSLLVTSVVVYSGVALGWAGLYSQEVLFGIKDWLISMTMMAHLARLATEVNLVDGAYWSLGVEIQFYVMIGLWVKWTRRSAYQMELFCALWLAASALTLLMPSWIPNVVLALPYAPYFVIGIVFAQMANKNNGVTRHLALIILSGVLILARLEKELGSEEEALVIWWVLAGVLVVGIFLCDRVSQMHEIKPLSITHWALLSYPLYLLHQNIGYVIMDVLTQKVGAPGWLSLVIAGLIVVVLAKTILTLSDAISRKIKDTLDA